MNRRNWVERKVPYKKGDLCTLLIYFNAHSNPGNTQNPLLRRKSRGGRGKDICKINTEVIRQTQTHHVRVSMLSRTGSHRLGSVSLTRHWACDHIWTHCTCTLLRLLCSKDATEPSSLSSLAHSQNRLAAIPFTEMEIFIAQLSQIPSTNLANPP